MLRGMRRTVVAGNDERRRWRSDNRADLRLHSTATDSQCCRHFPRRTHVQLRLGGRLKRLRLFILRTFEGEARRFLRRHLTLIDDRSWWVNRRWTRHYQRRRWHWRHFVRLSFRFFRNIDHRCKTVLRFDARVALETAVLRWVYWTRESNISLKVVDLSVTRLKSIFFGGEISINSEKPFVIYARTKGSFTNGRLNDFNLTLTLFACCFGERPEWPMNPTSINVDFLSDNFISDWENFSRVEFDFHLQFLGTLINRELLTVPKCKLRLNFKI